MCSSVGKLFLAQEQQLERSQGRDQLRLFKEQEEGQGGWSAVSEGRVVMKRLLREAGASGLWESIWKPLRILSKRVTIQSTVLKAHTGFHVETPKKREEQQGDKLGDVSNSLYTEDEVPWARGERREVRCPEIYFRIEGYGLNCSPTTTTTKFRC